MINITNVRFSELLQLYLVQDLSDSELDEFLEAARLPQYKPILEASVMKELDAKLKLQLAGKEREEKVWSDVLLQSGINTIESPQVPVKKLHSFNWLWRAAAVFILFVAGTAVYLFTHQPGQQQVVIKTKQVEKTKPLSPGKEGAILTLADGSHILLDDAQNGEVASQGGTNIVKNKGELSYKQASGKEILYNIMTTPKGRQYTLLLADGTKVWLNAASSIRFPTAFIGRERSVEITGEVYFEVAHNKQMPFRVLVNGAKVEVLGTHFNINAYADEETVKTTLLEGSIRYEAGARSLLIRPSEQVVVSRENNDLKLEHNVDLEATMAWKEGRFTFNRMPIDAIMRQVARWYDVEIEYNGAITKEVFSGDVSRQEEVTQLLDILQATKSVSFQINNSKIIVTSK